MYVLYIYIYVCVFIQYMCVYVCSMYICMYVCVLDQRNCKISIFCFLLFSLKKGEGGIYTFGTSLWNLVATPVAEKSFISLNLAGQVCKTGR